MFIRYTTLAGIGLLTLLSPIAHANDAPPAPGVTVETVSVATLPVVMEYPARTAGYREVQVRAQVSGILQERAYEEGSRVAKDQVLFRIDPRTYQAALARAKGALAQEQARYRQTERDLGRIRELQKKGFASGSELDNAISNFEQSKANIEAARAEVQARQIELDYTTVKAPISGITRRETVSEGSLIVAGDPNASLLTQITQLDPIYVNFASADAEVEHLRTELTNGTLVLPEDGKLQIEVVMADGSVYAEAGELNFTDSLVDPVTGTVSARGVIPNAEGKIMPGQFVRVRVKGLKRPDAITVPERAVAQGPQGTFVYVVDEQNTARVRPIKTGDTRDGRWLVLSGLKSGEKVIVDGVAKVRPDTPVNPQPAKAADAAPASGGNAP